MVRRRGELNSIFNSIKDYAFYQMYNQSGIMFNKHVVNRYGRAGTIVIYNDGSEEEKLIAKWFSKFGVDLISKETNSVNNFYKFKLDDNTYFVGTSRDNKSLGFEEIFTHTLGTPSNYKYAIHFYIFGRKCKKYYKEINKLLKSVTEKLYVFTVTGNKSGYKDPSGETRSQFNATMSNFFARNMDTLFFDDNVKEQIVEHIDKFNVNSEIYKDRNLIYKTGILLYGIPGTGKTSLASAIASYCNASLVVVDIGTFESLDTAEFVATLNADDNRYIVLLEDVDAIFNNLDRKDDNSNEKEKMIIQKLLQLLDSNTSPNNVIFLATTNYYDKLDDAIKRPGRFDLKLEIKPIYKKETAIEMCKSFKLSDEAIEDILANNALPISQSTLQTEILRRIK